MQVRIKKLHAAAVIPAYSKSGDAAMDLTAISVEKDDDGNAVYGTGLAIEIPDGYVGLLFPRSSNSKTHLYLTNHVGVIDSGYRGEIKFKFRPINGFIDARVYAKYDRVGQLIILPYPQIELVESDELSDSERGDGGFGSTGK
jgi:dUTP pyrophosphatase